MKFTAYGHPYITATHKNTFEFTREKHLTLKGDCIIGVNVDYTLAELQKLSGKIKTSIVNRYVIEMIGNRFNKLMLKRAKRKSNWMDLLYKGYNPSWFSKTMYPIAKWGLIQKYQNFA